MDADSFIVNKKNRRHLHRYCKRYWDKVCKLDRRLPKFKKIKKSNWIIER